MDTLEKVEGVSPLGSGGHRALNARRRALVFMLAIVLMLVVAKVATSRSDTSAPFPASAVNPKVTAGVYDLDHAIARVKALTGRGSADGSVAIGSGEAQYVVGQLTYALPPKVSERGTYVLFIIDRQSHLTIQRLSSFSPRGVMPSLGSDGRYFNVQDRYSWFRELTQQSTRAAPDASLWGVSFAPNAQSPVTFAATVDSPSSRITALPGRIGFVLAYLLGDQIYWAQDLSP